MKNLKSEINMIGFVARCRHGKVGLIMKEVNGVYKGIQLDKGNFGKPWQSKDPQIIEHIERITNDQIRASER